MNYIKIYERRYIVLSLFRKDPAKNSPPPRYDASLKKAVAFVDYEHWYISLKNNYGMQPNIKGWFEELNKSYNLTEVNFFADFSHKSLADEIGRIRLFSNKIIDTRSPNGVKKDFTDFIILDNMYQKALSSDDIEVFILFSGDGHFSSVTSFLKNFYHKEVVVYGVNGSFSKQLRETASSFRIIPDEAELNEGFYKHVFDYLKSNRSPTYSEALKEVTAKCRNRSEKQRAIQAMKTLQEAGIISERTLPDSRGKKKNMLFVDWEKAGKMGFHSENTH
ncbi:MAG: NYN domain-containing protein [Clostridia bacterium]|nr:NYN domain-containing protein [Clostridia bacterium]